MPHGVKGKGAHPWKAGDKIGPWKAGKVGPWKAGKKGGLGKKGRVPKEGEYNPPDFTPPTSVIAAQGKAAAARLARRGRGLGFGAGYLGAAREPKPFDFARLAELLQEGGGGGGGKKKKGKKKKGK